MLTWGPQEAMRNELSSFHSELDPTLICTSRDAFSCSLQTHQAVMKISLPGREDGRNALVGMQKQKEMLCASTKSAGE